MGDTDEASPSSTATDSGPDQVARFTDQLTQLRKTFLGTWEAEDLDEVVRVAREALATTDESHPGRPGLLDWLGSSLLFKYKMTEELAYLDEAISNERKAVEMAAVDSPERDKYSTTLALQLGDKYYHTLEASDLEEPIALLRKAVATLPHDSPNRKGRLGNLGITLKERYLRHGSADDFKDATESLRQAIALTPEGHEDRGTWLQVLVDLYDERSYRYQDLGHFEEALALKRETFLETNDDDPDKLPRQRQLASALLDSYLLKGDITDLNESIDIERESLLVPAEDDPDRFIRLKDLGHRLHRRYQETGEMSDLEECIEIGRKFMEEAEQDHPDRLTQLNNLSVNIAHRYDRLGEFPDIEEAIQLARQGLEATPDDDPVWPLTLSNLATFLTSRFTATGAMNDLEEAISLKRRVLQLMPDEHDGKPLQLHNLAVGLLSRYKRMEELPDLDEVVQLSRKAIELTPEDHPDRPVWLHDLVSALNHRFEKLEETNDLEEGIRLGREAIAPGRDGYTGRLRRYSTLATLLEKKFQKGGPLADIDEAIELSRKAVDMTSEDDPEQGIHQATLGGLFITRFGRTRAEEDIEAANAVLEKAVYQTSGNIRQRISAAATVLPVCLDEEQAYKIGRAAVELIPRLSSRSLETSDRQYLLTQAVGLVSHATAAALRANQNPLHALSLLEQGRGVLASSLEDMRADIEDLREEHPKLADQFVRLRDELDMETTPTSSFLGEDGQPVRNTRGNRRYDAGKAFDALVAEIREQPGFSDFLGPVDQEDIMAAAEKGPIVVLNVSWMGCDAILVEEHRVRGATLKVSELEISDRAKSDDLGSIETLEWLWDTITGPILDLLGFSEQPSDQEWPHVWWIPTGALTKFPLHASGRHEERSSDTVMDRVVSSYSPSIKALVHGRRRRVVEATPQALLVAMEHTPGHARLPYAAKEVSMLHNLCDSMSLKPVEPSRCKKDVVTCLKGCKIFHFAGHGYTDNLDPSNSHLCLENEADPLKVADLLEMNLHQYSPFLAYLSACGTGRVQDEKFIDESIHLISACQLAGFRHVIGTMWEVEDEHCVDVARITYESLRDKGMTDESICRGLHRATRMLRDRWLDAMDEEEGGAFEVGELGRSLEDGSSEGEPTDRGHVRMPRDLVVCDDDDETAPAYWVPYVHFGV